MKSTIKQSTKRSNGISNKIGTAEYYESDGLMVRFYDTITSVDPSVRGDIDYYAAYLRSPVDRVLELGCGTGRVANALAAKGHLVTGVDISEPMLRRARHASQRLLLHKNNVHYLLHDLVTLNLPIQYNLVIVPFHTFNHIDGRARRARALATMAAHLLPGAKAVIHAISPGTLQTKLVHTKLGHIWKSLETDERLEVTWNTQSISEDDGKTVYLVEYELFAADGKLIESSTHRLTYWWFDGIELERLARKAGLEHLETLKSFHSEQGNEQIYVLRKP